MRCVEVCKVGLETKLKLVKPIFGVRVEAEMSP